MRWARLPSMPIFTAVMEMSSTERIELRAKDRGGRDVHALYALRGLHGERRHRGDP